MFCAHCGKPLPDSHKFCAGCGSPVSTNPAPSSPAPPPAYQQAPPPPPLLPPIGQASSPFRERASGAVNSSYASAVGTRDERSGAGYIYPTNPPKSPHACWLNLLLAGVGQIHLGQVGKGLTIVVTTIVVSLLFPCVGTLTLAIIATVDAYQVGAALRAGKPVGNWEFFPSSQ